MKSEMIDCRFCGGYGHDEGGDSCEHCEGTGIDHWLTIKRDISSRQRTNVEAMVYIPNEGVDIEIDCPF